MGSFGPQGLTEVRGFLLFLICKEIVITDFLRTAKYCRARGVIDFSKKGNKLVLAVTIIFFDNKQV